MIRTDRRSSLLLGRGSNVLIRDKGIEGVVLRLGPDFGRITVKGVSLRAGAGAPLALVAETAARHSLSGLEFASGIPGSLGGGVYMNAGAYGNEMKIVVVAAEVAGRAKALYFTDAGWIGVRCPTASCNGQAGFCWKPFFS